MQHSHSSKLTRKGAHTRERILETALNLFMEKGYEATTMRDIAAASESSLGLTYRYFASKEELVLAFYTQMTEELATEVMSLPPDTVADRFVHLMRRKIQMSEPYRDAFGAFFGAALTPQSPIAMLGTQTTDLRHHVSTLFEALVHGATDTPRESVARDLATILYAIHLLILLFWLHDRSPESRATNDLLSMTYDGLVWLRRLLRFPLISRRLAQLAQTIRPVFTPDR